MACALTASGGRRCIIKCLVAWSKAGVFTPSPWTHGTPGSWQGLWRLTLSSPCLLSGCSHHPPICHPQLEHPDAPPLQRASLLEDIIQPHVPSLILFCCFEAPGLACFLDWEPLKGRSLVFRSLLISTAADVTGGLPVPSQLRPLGPEIRVPVFRSLPRAHWAPALVSNSAVCGKLTYGEPVGMKRVAGPDSGLELWVLSVLTLQLWRLRLRSQVPWALCEL